ncbi:MAG TPA: hypothetical protein VFC07_09970 [Verrucomicrobiae bacterium]|nr:hypothetical protein [Verrucomicrobiae bacterium]
MSASLAAAQQAVLCLVVSLNAWLMKWFQLYRTNFFAGIRRSHKQNQPGQTLAIGPLLGHPAPKAFGVSFRVGHFKILTPLKKSCGQTRPNADLGAFPSNLWFFAVFSAIEAGPGIPAKRAAWRALSCSARATLCGGSPVLWRISAQQISPRTVKQR